MRTVLRSGALIESWFDMLTDDQRPTARALHAAVVAALPQLHATVRWGNLVYQHEGMNTLAIAPHRSHVNLQVFRGVSLMPLYPQLEGGGRGVRHLKLRNHMPVDPDLVGRIAVSALDAVEAGADDAPDVAPDPGR